MFALTIHLSFPFPSFFSHFQTGHLPYPQLANCAAVIVLFKSTRVSCGCRSRKVRAAPGTDGPLNSKSCIQPPVGILECIIIPLRARKILKPRASVTRIQNSSHKHGTEIIASVNGGVLSRWQAHFRPPGALTCSPLPPPPRAHSLLDLYAQGQCISNSYIGFCVTLTCVRFTIQ